MTEERWHNFAKEKPSEDMEGRNFIVSNGHYEKIATWCGYWENEPFMGNKLCDEVVRWKGYLTPEEEKASETTRTELKAEYIDDLYCKFYDSGMPMAYLKDEVDELLAEKDAEIARLTEDWNRLCEKYNKFIKLKQEFFNAIDKELGR